MHDSEKVNNSIKTTKEISLECEVINPVLILNSKGGLWYQNVFVRALGLYHFIHIGRDIKVRILILPQWPTTKGGAQILYW